MHSSYENLKVTRHDDGVWVVTLARPAKRNALNAETIEELVALFSGARAAGAGAIVLNAEGDHFCAGLDLVEHHQEDRSPEAFWQLCLRWHEAFNKMEYGGVPVIAALKGAVVGGGLELASAAHIRVADLVGKARMIDMMLTGRVYKGDEAISVGLAQYLVQDSEAKALELAQRAAQNLPLTNFAICSAISHMQNMSSLDAAYAEACVAGIVNTQAPARARLQAFADKTAARVRPD